MDGSGARRTRRSSVLRLVVSPNRRPRRAPAAPPNANPMAVSRPVRRIVLRAHDSSFMPPIQGCPQSQSSKVAKNPFLLLEECDQLAPAQLTPEFHLSGLVHAVDLEDGLGGIQADHANAHGGRLPCCRFQRPTVWHIEAVGAVPPICYEPAASEAKCRSDIVLCFTLAALPSPLLG